MEFLRQNARWLAAGALLTGASGFGQTFFISLYAGEIRTGFRLSDGQWGLIYTAGTLLSAALMLWAGQWADRMPVRRLATIILLMFSGACAAMAINYSAALLVLVIFGLRFCGQGMLSHITFVAAGRWYAANRGRAVSIMSLGYAVAEALLPILFVALMALLPWRATWLIAACAALTAIPLLSVLLRVRRNPLGKSESLTTTGMQNRHWTRKEALTNPLFWFMLPAVLALPVFSTALFFQQVHLAGVKGWSLAGWVALIPLMTASSVGAMLISGRLIDLFGSRRFVGLTILPAAFGFLVLWSSDSLATAAVAMVLLGASHGMNNTFGGTFWPDFYGTQNLGAIRSVATSVMVFGSALGPGITGVLIDLGWSFEDQMIGISVLMLAAAALAIFGVRREISRVSA